jgi:hypothetical protein
MGKRASDELGGKGSDKHGGTCDIIETKLVLQAKSRCVLHRPLLAPLYRWPGLEVLVEFDTDSSPMADLHTIFPIRIQKYIGSYLGP